MKTIKLISPEFKNYTGYIPGDCWIKDGEGQIQDVLANDDGYINRICIKYDAVEIDGVEYLNPSQERFNPSRGVVKKIAQENVESKKSLKLEYLTDEEIKRLESCKYEIDTLERLMNLKVRSLMGILKCNKDRAINIRETYMAEYIKQI